MEPWDEWIFSAKIDPLEHALSFLLGVVIGMTTGFAFCWTLLAK